MAFNLIVEPRIKGKKIADPLSSYRPPEKIRLRLAEIMKEMAVADEIRNKTYKEFNNRSLIQYQDDCQKAFNTYVPPTSESPDEAWRANTVRPVTRNKVISIVAHITSGIMAPVIEAQNRNAISDKDAAMVMKDLMDYVLEQCQYSRKFVFGMIAAAVNPAVIFEAGYLEVIRKFKEILDNGKWKEKEALDEVFSGFFLNLVPVEELYIGDIYEHDIQKQPFIIRRRVIDYTAAKIKYGEIKEFKKYVTPGVRVFYDPDTSSFYEQEDDQLSDRKVEEVVYYNRLADLELVIVNGVLLTDDPDRPMQRKDKFYPFAKGGYELIDEGRFFYYKSLVDKMAPDQKVIDVLYNMVIDGTFLQLFPPMANYGGEEVHSNVMIPGMVTNRPTSEVGSLQPIINSQSNLNAGMTTIQKVESSLSESSQDPRAAGQSTSGSQTAFEVARLEENAKQILGLFGKMVGFIVEDIGKLLTGIILQYMTFAEIEEVVGDTVRLKYQSVLVPDRSVDGKKMPRRIDFETPEEDMMIEPEFQVPGLEETQQRTLQNSTKIRREENKLGIKIAKADPVAFREMKFKVKSTADFLKPMSEQIIKAMNLEAYDRLIRNPIANQEAALRDFLLENYKPGEAEKYINKQPQMPVDGPQPTSQDMIKKVLGKRMQQAA